MAKVHMIHGFLCVGKTAFATDLASRSNGVCFSVDEWMVAIFGPNTPDDGWSRELFDDRNSRIRGLMDSVWPSIVRAGVDVVLDYGFWRRNDRDQIRDMARGVGAEIVMYELRCPEDVARARCMERTKLNTGGSFYIDDDAYEDLKGHFEPIDDDEPSVIVETG